MTIQDMFQKPIDRHIDGVIKADDERSLFNEVDEYVLTRPIETALDNLIDHYLTNSQINGVWISGFFGSGKSHLLKMLALLLENRKVGDTDTLTLFQPKLEENIILKENVKKACKIPSKSILFNISQKSNTAIKSRSDALLGVFVDVFNEICGYYSKSGYIAQFERDLDRRSLFDKFKEEFENLAGLPWEMGREQYSFETGNIAKAFSAVTGTDPDDVKRIISDYKKDYHMSIEDFALLVKEYLDKQEPGFRINFFVDEISQYIADDSRLLLDLQTIAESLQTKCNGKAWIFVTAQEELKDIIGKMSALNGDQVSKIQGRFREKIKLTSANVDEVIRLRLLAKNQRGEEELGSLYLQQQNNLKTLFDLPDGKKEYHNFKDREHFVSSYPFIPYQFMLFQSSIQNLSKHDAFSGKFQSVGERSMLEVFQFVVQKIARKDHGRLATFDLMFEGIRATIKGEIQWGITQVEELIDDVFTQKLLKVLFLVKYVQEFQATPGNLSVLLIDHFDMDLQALRKRIDESLVVLEQQTYIKRSEGVYEYLTDKERDVETEIKNTLVDPQALKDQMSKLFYTSVLSIQKFRYEQNNQDFPFTKRIDNTSSGKEYDLAVNIRTDDHDKDNLSSRSMEYSELVVGLADDVEFFKENQLYLQTETYIKQNASRTQNAEQKSILTERSKYNQQRYEELKRGAERLLSESVMFVNGNEIQSSSTVAKTRINEGFQTLIESAYSQLVLLGSRQYDEKNIPLYLNKGKEKLQDLIKKLGAAEHEIITFITMNKNDGIKTTVKSLLDKFEKKPYGWPVAAVLCLLAELIGMAKLELINDSPVEEKDIERTLRNTKFHANTIVNPTQDIDQRKVKKLKEVISDSFHTPAKSSEAKALGTEFAQYVEKELDLVREYLSETSNFPFLTQLESVKDELIRLKGKTYTWYYEHLDSFSEELPSLVEDYLSPIRTFMEGSQRSIYEDARSFMELHKYNLSHLDGSEAEDLKKRLNDPNCFRGNRINEVKEIKEFLQEKMGNRIKAVKQESLEKVQNLREKLTGMSEFAALDALRKETLEAEFSSLETELNNTDQIAVLRDTVTTFEGDRYSSLVQNVITWSTPEPSRHPDDGETAPPVATKKVIQATKLKPVFTNAILNDEQDVDSYLKALKDSMLAELEKGNTIQV